jgi:hypothetical protein
VDRNFQPVAVTERRSARAALGKPNIFGFPIRTLGRVAALVISTWTGAMAATNSPLAMARALPLTAPTASPTPRSAGQSLPLNGSDWDDRAIWAHLHAVSLPSGVAGVSSPLTRAETHVFAGHLSLAAGKAAGDAGVLQVGFTSVAPFTRGFQFVAGSFEHSVPSAGEVSPRVDSRTGYALLATTYLPGQCFEVADGMSRADPQPHLYIFDLCKGRLVFAKSLYDRDWGPNHRESFMERYAHPALCSYGRPACPRTDAYSVSLMVNPVNGEEIPTLAVFDRSGAHGYDEFKDATGVLIVGHTEESPRIPGWSMMETQDACVPVRTGADGLEWTVDDHAQARITTQAPAFAVRMTGIAPPDTRMRITPPTGMLSSKFWSVDIRCQRAAILREGSGG